ncbi:MAG: hypothetical protein RIE08_08900 [Acidimicrobiales bacterium]
MAALEDLTERLAKALARLPAESLFTIYCERPDAHSSDEQTERHFQFARYDGGDIRAETIGPGYLGDGDDYTDDDLATLSRLGWMDPDGGGNFWRRWESSVPCDGLAAMVLATAEQVHGVADLSQLAFGGPPGVLDALGATRRPSQAAKGAEPSKTETPSPEAAATTPSPAPAQSAEPDRVEPNGWYVHSSFGSVLRTFGSPIDRIEVFRRGSWVPWSGDYWKFMQSMDYDSISEEKAREMTGEGNSDDRAMTPEDYLNARTEDDLSIELERGIITVEQVVEELRTSNDLYVYPAAEYDPETATMDDVENAASGSTLQSDLFSAGATEEQRDEVGRNIVRLRKLGKIIRL